MLYYFLKQSLFYSTNKNAFIYIAAGYGGQLIRFTLLEKLFQVFLSNRKEGICKN